MKNDPYKLVLQPSPFSFEEMKRRPPKVAATADVPEELRSLAVKHEPSALEHIRLERTELGKIADAPAAPFQPEWLGQSLRPERLRQLGRAPRKLNHYGLELDPMYVFQPDDRKVYHDTSYPWGCLCRVSSTDRSRGSGILIGPRHVLTASHIVDWSTQAGTVEVHRAGPYVSATSRYERVIGFTKMLGESRSYSEVDEDYAVIITAERLGDRFGWLGVRTYHSSWDDEPYWWNVGYPGDLYSGVYPVYQNRVSLDEDEWDFGEARALKTKADLMKGQSGSPMFGFWEDGPYAVAVASAIGKNLLGANGNYCSAGSLLTRLARYARDFYP